MGKGDDEEMIRKEIREKIEKKLELDAELTAWMEENIDVEGFLFDSIQIVDEPCGECQGNGEYCDQSVGYCEDDFYGYYYIPLDNGKYLCIYYEC